MKFHSFLSCWICAIFLIYGSVKADYQLASSKDTPAYYYDIMTKAAQDSGLSELKIFVKIAHDELQFLTEGDLYKARYELTISVLDESESVVESSIKGYDVIVATFDETNAPYTYSFAEVTFVLNPASYTILLGLSDLDSERGGQQKVDIDLIDYWKFDFSMSDLLLADTTYTSDDGMFRLEPNVLWNLGSDANMLNLYFEIYSTVTFEALPIQVFIRNPQDQVVYEWQQQIAITKFRTPVVQKLSKSEVKAGKYKIEIQVGTGKIMTRRIKDLTIRWMNNPLITTDLNKAIEQLRYIASSDDIKEMKEAEGDAKKVKFETYWQSVDPTPETELNELMVEYYQRIEYANQHFSGYTEGWLSDRGLVYIILGAPDDIERHPFEQGSKPYIIWSYYLQGRDFVFVDHTGFGDYRLQNPYWEVYSAR